MACFLYRSIAIFLIQLVLWAIFHFLTECFLFLVATLVVTSRFERLFVYEDDSSSPFRNSSGYVFYLRSNHTFSWFLKSNWSSDFRHAETGSGAKERVVLWLLFHSYFKSEWENGVWIKIRFLASVFLFTCGNFALNFTVFLFIFFLNGFPNLFIVHSRPSFLFQSFFFSLVALCSHVAF